MFSSKYLYSGPNFGTFLLDLLYDNMLLDFDDPGDLSLFLQILGSLAGRFLSLLFGDDPGSEASVNQKLHHPSRSGPAALTPTFASSSVVEQPIPEDKPYIALLQLEGERKHILEEIVHFVEAQLEDPRLPRGPHEQALRFLWSELEIDEKSSLFELKYWRGSVRENLRQY
ncbi:hypothetical protein VNO80_25228 [Phaseolus coccineus]|uniref:Uncharacterized protein n=1 Tax=Phaseolus coccineus TaxID=3886 RepID=A0AAN9LUW1_PHACN